MGDFVSQKPIFMAKKHLNLYKYHTNRISRFCPTPETNQSVSIQFSAGLFCALQAVRAQQSPGGACLPRGGRSRRACLL